MRHSDRLHWQGTLVNMTPCLLGKSDIVRLLIVAFWIIVSVDSTSSQNEPLQLNIDNFELELQYLSKNSSILLEFYASWCPTCQHFQPEYERIADYFHSIPRVEPEVTVARVDCASQADLCNHFGISRYPTLKFGQANDFLVEKSRGGLQIFVGARNSKSVVEWIGQLVGVAYNFDSTRERQEHRESVAIGAAVTQSGLTLHIAKEADNQDVEMSTILAFKYLHDSPQLLEGFESRTALKDFVDLLAIAHPVDRCRIGAKKLQQDFDHGWPQTAIDGPTQELKDILICGQGPADKGWRACKGSREGTRGYTCGLWLLFHSLAGRVADRDTGGSAWLRAVKGYVEHFFQCTDCAKHFTAMASEDAAKAVTTQREAVLWAWRAHNEVNRRLESMERAEGDGDPAFPKSQWPSSELCPLCRLTVLSKKAGVTWNEDEVYRFLLNYYHGNMEPGWVTQKLDSGSQLLGIGGRKQMSRARKRQPSLRITTLLVLAVIIMLAACILRIRGQRTRRIVSL